MKTSEVAICIAIGLAALFSTTIAFSKSEERTILNTFVLVFGMDETLLQCEFEEMKKNVSLNAEAARMKYVDLNKETFNVSPVTSKLNRKAVTLFFTVNEFEEFFKAIFTSPDVNKTRYSADDCLLAFEQIGRDQLSDLGSILVLTLSPKKQDRNIEKYLILIQVLNADPSRTPESLSAAFCEFTTNGVIEMPVGQQDTKSKFLKRYRGEPYSPETHCPPPRIFY